MSGSALVLVAWLGLAAAFAGIYVLARRLDNYGIVDIAWSYAFGLVAVFYAALGPGWPVRRLLIAGAVAVWSARLGTHLLIRIARHHPEEDGRYQELRRTWSGNFNVRMGLFFQLQAASVAVLALPFLWACRNPLPRLQPLEIAGAALWIVALLGEALSDAQLAAFKRDPARRGQVCDTGLWRLSRHPNYFCEWLIWMAYFVFACGSPWGWTSVLSPASILFLLLSVTGIPMTEAQSVRSKGDAYRRYQARTSAFVPWLPRS